MRDCKSAAVGVWKTTPRQGESSQSESPKNTVVRRKEAECTGYLSGPQPPQQGRGQLGQPPAQQG